MAAADELPISFSRIEDIAGGNPDFIRNLLGVLVKNLQEFPGLLAKLQQEQNYPELAEQAHKFKSGISYIDCAPFTECLMRLETSQERELPPERIAQLIVQATDYSARVMPSVEAEIARLS